MYGINHKKLLCIITISILLLTIVPNGSADLFKMQNTKKQSILEDLPENIDTEFLLNVTNEISKMIEKHPRGREYGTEGEREASEILERIWRENISEDVTRERIDNNEANDNIDYKIDIINYSLKIGEEEVKKTDCFPFVPYTFYYEEDEIHKEYDYNSVKIRDLPKIFYVLFILWNKRNKLSSAILAFIAFVLISLLNGSNNLNSEKIKKFEQTSRFEDDFYWLNPTIQTIQDITEIEDYTYEFTSYVRYIQPRSLLMGDFDLFNFPEGVLHTDVNDDTCFMQSSSLLEGGITSNGRIHGYYLPGIMTNGTVIDIINNNPYKNFEYYVEIENNFDTESYNVIGTIPGKSEEIIVIGAHYDSWWNYCVIDNALCVGIVWSLAKYFNDNYIKKGILPDYTLKFIAFGGEEFGCRGSKHYVRNHIYQGTEEVKFMINLDTVAYKPRLPLYNKGDTPLNIWQYPENSDISQELEIIPANTNYNTESGGYPYRLHPNGGFGLDASDGSSFAGFTNVGVIAFDKGEPVKASHFYHRTGSNHTKGDTWDMLDYQDLYATTKVILNTAKFAIDY